MLLNYQHHNHLQFVCSLNIPDGHVGSGDNREADGSGETLVTGGIIVLEADLELDGLEEVPLLRLQGVLEEFLNVGTHSGCGDLSQSLRGSSYCWGRRGNHTDCDFRHDYSLPVESTGF